MASSFDRYGFSSVRNSKISSFGQFGSFNKSRADELSDVDNLLLLAQQKGGAIGDVATELMHPNKGVLSTLTEGFKNAFSDFVNIISMPSQFVAGALSSKITTREAIAKNIGVSDVVWGKIDPKASAMQKVGGFAVRLVTDVLTDPLTYITFGASAGVFGIKSLSKIAAGEEIAGRLGKEVGQKVALTSAGQKILNKAIAFQVNGQRALYAQEGIKQGLKEGSKELEMFVGRTINRELDVENASKVTSRLLGKMVKKNPELLNTYIDKGGIKFFGKTILEGQRINSAIKLIPGVTTLDIKTQNARYALYGLFSTKFSVKYGRRPQEALDIIQKRKDLYNKGVIKSIEEPTRLYRKYKVTPVEDDMIRFAVENNINTKGEGINTLLDAYKNSIQNSGMLKQEGEFVHAALDWNVSSADSRIFDLQNKYRSITKEALADTRAAGIPLVESSNHVRHFLVDNPIKKIPFSMGPSTKLGAAKEAKVVKFVDTTRKASIISRTGAEGAKLTRKIASEEVSKITKGLDEFVTAKNLEKSTINKSISNLNQSIRAIFKDRAGASIKTLFKDANVGNKKEVLKFVDDFVERAGDLDVNKTLQKHIKDTFEQGVKKKVEKVTSESILGADDVKKIIASLKGREGLVKEDVEKINKILKSKIVKIKKGATKIKPKTAKQTKEIADDLSDFLISEQKSKIAKMVKSGISEKDTAVILKSLKESFEANPIGAKVLLNQITKHGQVLRDITESIGAAEQAAKYDTLKIEKLGEYFEDIDGNTFKRVRATVEEAASVGVMFDRSALSTLVKSSLENNRIIQTKGLINDLMGDTTKAFSKPASEAPEGWVPVKLKQGAKEMKLSELFTSKKGEELYFHPAVAEALENFTGSIINDAPTQKLLQQFDKIQGAWKASVTSIFPAFHGRNAISNVFLNFLDIGLHSINPTNHVASASMLNKENKAVELQQLMVQSGKVGDDARNEFIELMSTKVFKDKTGYEWTFGEMRRVLSDNGIAFNPNLVGSIDVYKSTSELVEDLLPKTTAKGIAKQTVTKKINPLSQEFIPFKVGRRVGNIVEEHARILNFLVNLRETGDVMHAAQRTKMFLFDYQNLTGFEKTFLRRIIPFYTWTRKNIGLQAKTLTTSPGRIATEFHTLTTIGDVLTGAHLTKKERNFLPDWIKDGMIIPTKKNGSNIELLGGLGTPTEAVFQAIQPNSLLGSISPLIRVPIEQMSGYDFFRGKPLSEITNATAFKSAPKVLKDFIGYTEVTGKNKEGKSFKFYVSLRPERMHLISNLPPTTRVLSSLKQMQNEDVSTQFKTLQQIVGVRPYSFDLEEEAAKREKKLRRGMEDILNKAGIIGKFEKTFIPKN